MNRLKREGFWPSFFLTAIHKCWKKISIHLLIIDFFSSPLETIKETIPQQQELKTVRESKDEVVSFHPNRKVIIGANRDKKSYPN
ncbi:hypothetical protein [Pararhodonellum marinum]|uniref:hypothetical protein n=1 Tax=Pararhodonellum marinum TaxID=2755358 RepID=UPI00188F78F6|nr:hypothetical protein [Pararhodonellum marinum]